jgi:hypothetical protein
LPFLNPRTFLLRTPRFMRMGRPDIEVRVEERSSTEVLLVVTDSAHTPAQLYCGVLEPCLARMGVTAAIEVIRDEQPAVHLRVSWPSTSG